MDGVTLPSQCESLASKISQLSDTLENETAEDNFRISEDFCCLVAVHVSRRCIAVLLKISSKVMIVGALAQQTEQARRAIIIARTAHQQDV